MELKPGYRRTEVGLVPEEWQDCTIGDLIDFEGGSQPNKTAFRSTWTPGYIRLVQIRDYKTDRFATYIPTSLARRFCSKNDIMIGRYGPPVFQILRGIDGAYNVALIKAKPTPPLNRDYAYYFLKQDSLFLFIEKLSRRSSGQTGVDLGELRRYPLPLPPTKAEQEAIAQALTDADALIESLEQLLAKKRLLKQGAMQELLTGKKRLPGFQTADGNLQTEIGVIPADWRLEPIENFAQITTGGKNAQDSIADGQYPFFVRSKTVERINSYSFDGEAVLTAGDGVGTGKVFHYIKGKFDAHQRVYRISHFAEEVNGYFFFLYFSTHFFARIMQMTAKSSVDSVRREMIAKMLVPIPRSKDEQIAIAAVLSDMDAEINALEAKLTKARHLKQAMMQELLTGRIRLVPPVDQSGASGSSA